MSELTGEEASRDQYSRAADLSTVHGKFIPWIERALRVETLSQESLRYIAEELSERYDLMGSPDRLEDDERENIVDEMRRQIRRERAATERLTHEMQRAFVHVLTEAGEDLGHLRVTLPEALRQASATAQYRAAGRTFGGKQRQIRVQGQGHDPDADDGDQRPQRPAMLVDLLTPEEKASAEAIGASLVAILSALPEVARFQRQMLFGRRQLLTSAEAEEWIRSPEARFLSVEDFENLGIGLPSARERTATILEWESQPYDALGAYSDNESDDDAKGNNGDGASDEEETVSAFRGFSPAGFLTNWRYRVRLRIKRLGKKATGVHLVKGHRNGEGQPAEESEAADAEVVREMLTTPDGLLWIPFLPRDVKGPSDEVSHRGDETFPRMFEGSAADALGRLGERLARSLPFEAWEICWFILTGESPAYLPVAVSLWSPCSLPMKRNGERGAKRREAKDVLSRYWSTFMMRAQIGRPVRGYVQIRAEPWVSPETVARYHRHYRQQLLITARDDQAGDTTSSVSGGSIAKTGGTSSRARSQRTGRLPSVGLATWLKRAAAQQLARMAQVAHVRLGAGETVTEPTGSVASSWRDMHSQFRRYRQEGQPEEKEEGRNDEDGGDRAGHASSGDSSGDYSNFVKSCKHATEILDLPACLGALLDRLTGQR